MAAAKKEKPKHLGRGLASLIGPINMGDIDSGAGIPIQISEHKYPADKELGKSLCEIKLSRIRPNPYQPRSSWNDQELMDLSASISANGVIQPVLLRKSGNDYELIAGERRFRAAEMASLETIPAIVRKASDAELLELALVENIHRSDLNPLERSKAYQNYLNSFSLTQSEAAKRLGEDRSVISNYLRLLDLPEEIRRMLAERKLSMGHARAILSLPSDQLRRKLANRAMAGRLSVREVERLVRRFMATQDEVKAKAMPKNAHIIDLERRMTDALGTKVNIETRRGGQRGKIVIDFYSLNDFDRIAECMGLGAGEEV